MAIAVSYLNQCPFSLDVHSMVLRSLSPGAGRWLPETVRQWFLEQPLKADRTSGQVGRGWTDEALKALDSKLRPTARILLLAARAPYQVIDADIDAFRIQMSDQRALLYAAAWASLRRAREIAARE